MSDSTSTFKSELKRIPRDIGFTIPGAAAFAKGFLGVQLSDLFRLFKWT